MNFIIDYKSHIKNIEIILIISSIPSNHNGIKLEVLNIKTTRNIPKYVKCKDHTFYNSLIIEYVSKLI